MVFGEGSDRTSYFGVSTSLDGRWVSVTVSLGTAPRNDCYLADLGGTARPGRPATTGGSVLEGVDAQAWPVFGRDGRMYLRHRPRRASPQTGARRPGPARPVGLARSAGRGRRRRRARRRRPGRRRHRRRAQPPRPEPGRRSTTGRPGPSGAAVPLPGPGLRRSDRPARRGRRGLDRLHRPRHAVPDPAPRRGLGLGDRLGRSARMERKRSSGRSPPARSPTSRPTAHEGADVRDRRGRPPMRPGRPSCTATAASTSRSPRPTRRPSWPGSRPAASTPSPTCGAAAKRARSGTATGCGSTSSTCSTTSPRPPSGWSQTG